MSRRGGALAAVALVAALAVDRLAALGQPLTYDQVTQRALNATFPVADLLAGRYPDARHPPLGYLVLAPFAQTSLDEAWIRLPTVGASLLALLALYGLARRVVGPWPALLPVALHGLSLGWLAESRSISDLPLFVLLALASSHAVLAALERPTAPRLAAWASGAAAMGWTWFLAPVVLAAQLAAVAVARPAAWGRWLTAAAVMAAAAAPMAPRLAAVLVEDAQLRRVAALDPTHVWGDRGPVQLLREAAAVVAPSPVSAAALAGLVAIGGWRLWRDGRRAEATLTAGLPALAVAVTATATLHVRLQPYYLLFAVPFAWVAATAALRGRVGALVGALLLADAGRVYAAGLTKTLGVQAGDDFAGVAAVLADGPPDAPIVAEPHYLASTLAWHVLDDPGAAWRACRISPDRTSQTCGERLRFLRLTSKLIGDWQAEDVERLRALRGHDLWFIEHVPFPNEALSAALAATCERRAALRGLVVWWCPAVADADAPPPPAPPAAQPPAHPAAN